MSHLLVFVLRCQVVQNVFAHDGVDETIQKYFLMDNNGRFMPFYTLVQATTLDMIICCFSRVIFFLQAKRNIICKFLYNRSA
jgi:hypothetical protein